MELGYDITNNSGERGGLGRFAGRTKSTLGAPPLISDSTCLSSKGALCTEAGRNHARMFSLSQQGPGGGIVYGLSRTAGPRHLHITSAEPAVRGASAAGFNRNRWARVGNASSSPLRTTPGPFNDTGRSQDRFRLATGATEGPGRGRAGCFLAAWSNGQLGRLITGRLQVRVLPPLLAATRPF